MQGQFGVRHRAGGQYTPGPCPTGSACCRTVRRCGSWPTSSKSSPEYRAVCRRPTAADDWFFDGHFPGEPVVPAIVLVELLAQTGGLAIGSGAAAGEPLALRVAALGGFKFPGAAVAGDVLEATARVVGRMGGLYKIEGRGHGRRPRRRGRIGHAGRRAPLSGAQSVARPSISTSSSRRHRSAWANSIRAVRPNRSATISRSSGASVSRTM